jgi:hypothetical protein
MATPSPVAAAQQLLLRAAQFTPRQKSSNTSGGSNVYDYKYFTVARRLVQLIVLYVMALNNATGR